MTSTARSQPLVGQDGRGEPERWREGSNPPPEWAEGIARWYILCARMNQILNRKDLDYFHKNGQWPKQKNGSRGCRGILALSHCEAMNISAFEFYGTFGEWPTLDDGEFRLPAEVVPIGTNTFRCRHRKVVNIPSRGLYPLRDLFIASPGHLILGCDGAGLELRMLSHFMWDPSTRTSS